MGAWEVLPVLRGFPGRSSRGFLGWSSAYLVRGGGLVLLFDTGGPGDREGLLAGLFAHGVRPEEVGVVVLSHLHYDHAAGADLFPQARVLAHPLELRHAPQDPLAWTRLPSLTPVEEGELAPGLRLWHLAGHTPGLLGLEVEGVGLLASDALKSRFDLEGPPAPPCWDEKEAVRSRERVKAYPLVFPGHDVPLRKGEGGFIPLGQAEGEVVLPTGARVKLFL
jgi:glyoxylase-like metal-dependent hydrolase (beta-lactamase superfamily II)